MPDINAIDAVKNYYNSLDSEGKANFQKETGFGGLSSLSIMSYDFAEQFCKSHNINLNTDSAWNLYYKGKADYAEALGRYNEAEAIYQDLKSQQDTAKAKYDTLVKNYVADNGEDTQISSTKDKEFRNESKYTTDLIKNTKAADSAVILALDARRNAVNEQRHGLMYGAGLNLRG